MLHTLTYSDPDQGGRQRPVMHRGSIAEMAVPYAGGWGGRRERTRTSGCGNGIMCWMERLAKWLQSSQSLGPRAKLKLTFL